MLRIKIPESKPPEKEFFLHEEIFSIFENEYKPRRGVCTGFLPEESESVLCRDRYHLIAIKFTI